MARDYVRTALADDTSDEHTNVLEKLASYSSAERSLFDQFVYNTTVPIGTANDDDLAALVLRATEELGCNHAAAQASK